MKRVFLTAMTITFVAACTSTSTQEDPNRYFEPQGEFSFVPPEGWTPQDGPGLKYQIVSGSPTEGFTPNLNVVDEPFQGSLDEYADANLAALPQFFQSFKLISRQEFAPNEGSAAVRLSVENTQGGLDLFQIFYLFPADGRYFVVTCTRLANSQVTVDALCDQSMKTFRIEE